MTPTPLYLSTPDRFKPLEKLIWCVSAYTKGCFENQCWTSSLESEYLTYARGLCNDDIGSFHLECTPAWQLMKIDMYADAGIFFVKAAARIEKVLRQQSPRMLSTIFDLIFVLYEESKSEFASELVLQCRNVARVLFPDSPLVQFFEEISILNNGSSPDKTVASALECQKDAFESVLGPNHYVVIDCKIKVAAMIRGKESLDAREIYFRQMAQPPNDFNDSTQISGYCRTQRALIRNLYDQQKHVEIERGGSCNSRDVLKIPSRRRSDCWTAMLDALEIGTGSIQSTEMGHRRVQPEMLS